ncbi:BTB/POZ domain-containing protein 9 isoform X1 [Drosophila obscura]|uniref:BTB/POZ domain-containing protein 9 isoform X1 n=1 Tax=Drosophila obscura TaxID=7282 RepID=UPI001BB10A3E|nr:BTB/POZ domain-containing protein 9 isoform X1 [Drosophila obscura]
MSSQGHHKMHRSSSSTGKSNKPEQEFTDEIDLCDRFSADMARLCMNEHYSDVEFVVEEQLLPAHRVILAARSEYFRALLYGGMSETTQRRITLEVSLDPFKVLLRYIYSGTLLLSTLDEDAVIDVLGMANQYGFQDLEMAISKYLRQYLALSNVCMILDAARLYNLDELTNVCLAFMDRNARDLLQHDSFKMLSKESLEEVLRRDSFFAAEVHIFQAVWKWSRYNPNVDIKSVVSFVRLPLMNLEDLLQVVRPSTILEPDKILDALQERSTSKSLPYRAALWPDENVATEKHDSHCIQGDCRSALLDGDVTDYDMENGYTRHSITENDAGIVVELGTTFMINHIRMLLWDRDSRAYSYYVEVSGDMMHWECVVDYSEFHCRSWQYLYFPARAVRYIRLVGTQNTVNRVFHVVGLEAMHTSNVPDLVGHFVAPQRNVATVDLSAIVTDGVSRTRNALINGDYVRYDWDSGYTCHQLGSGDIVVRLGQPYHVGSMRLLLWDCDDRTYSFYIETSTNRRDWQIVVDRRNDKVRSWQNFHFTPRPVVFIRIVGTRNTANESQIQIFHCVHLECPSQDKSYLKEKEKEKEFARERERERKRDLGNLLKPITPTDDNIASTSASAIAALAAIGSSAADEPNENELKRNIPFSTQPADALLDVPSKAEAEAQLEPDTPDKVSSAPPSPVTTSTPAEAQAEPPLRQEKDKEKEKEKEQAALPQPDVESVPTPLLVELETNEPAASNNSSSSSNNSSSRSSSGPSSPATLSAEGC